MDAALNPDSRGKDAVSETPSPGEGTTKDISATSAVVPKAPVEFRRSSSSFLRVSDLEMDQHTANHTMGEEEREAEPNYHHAASDPPPGIKVDGNEKWIALGDSEGRHYPIAPEAVHRLATTALSTVLDAEMWKPDRKTEKMLKKASSSDWLNHTFQPGAVVIPEGSQEYEKDVFTWSGNFQHNFHGGDVPAIRVTGIVNMSARSLVEMLLDSSRVKEYNKLSLGREDIVVFQDDLQKDGPFGPSVTKITKSTSKPPMIKRLMVFVTLCHAKQLEDGSGFLVVNRAAHGYDGTKEDQTATNTIKGEILLGVQLIRTIEGRENQCTMTNVSHMKASMLPMTIAKKIGVTAATGFINDIRKTCS